MSVTVDFAFYLITRKVVLDMSAYNIISNKIIGKRYL